MPIFAARLRARPNRIVLPALAALTMMIWASAAADAARDRYFDIRKNFSDERVLGSTNVHIAGMDPVNAPWTVGVKGTAIAPPDISVIIPKGGQGPAGLGIVAAPPKCTATSAVTPENLNGCLDEFGVELANLDTKLRAAADNEQGIQRRSRRLLGGRDDLTEPKAYAALKETITGCIFGVATNGKPIVCPKPDSATETDKPTALGAIDAADSVYRDATTDYARISGSLALNSAKDPVKARLTAYKAALDSDKVALDTIDKFRHDMLEPLVITQYFYEVDAKCGVLFNSGREKQITLTIGTSDTRDVTVVCPTPVFVGLGLGFDGLSNHTFTGIAPNPAGQPAPPAGATPAPATIVQNDSGSRVVAQTMLHLAIPPTDDEGSGLAFSMGIGVPVFNGGGGSVDLLTGLSYEYHSTIVVTAGIAFGKTQQLANGYAIGGLVASGTTPPTLNRYSSALFVGVSFAK